MDINLFFNYIKYREKEKKREKKNKINLYVCILFSATIQLEYNICVAYRLYQIDSAGDRRLIGNKKGTYGQSVDRNF